MSDSLFGNRWRALLLVGLSVVGIVLTIRSERTSESRANRLHRSDRLEAAADIYGDHVLQDSTTERLHYNLGTTLLRLGDPAAATQLVEATDSDNERIRIHAFYNLGLVSLIGAFLAQSDDSVLIHARSAVEANKAALRLDPDHIDAGWNLVLAQRILDADFTDFDPGNQASPDEAPDLAEVQIIEGPAPVGQEEGYGESPSEGEEETLAAEDLPPLSLTEASDILGTGHLDPSTMTGKLLLREGRELRRRGRFNQGTPW